MTRALELLACIALVSGCKKSQSAIQTNARVAAVSLCLQKFFAEAWVLGDPATYIAPNPYSSTLPSRLAGKTVEVIYEDELSTRFSGREVAPQLVMITVYEVEAKPDSDFCIDVSISAVWGRHGDFRMFPEGGNRTYEISVVSNSPVIERTFSVEH